MLVLDDSSGTTEVMLVLDDSSGTTEAFGPSKTASSMKWER